MFSNLAQIIKIKRKKFNLTQVALAYKTNLSLPTIQNIESGKANPTIDVLEKLLSFLGLETNIKSKSPDWNYLISYGLPMQDENIFKSRNSFNIKKFLTNVILACENNELLPREKEALRGLLLALKSHYPSIYNTINNFGDTILNNNISGRDIKLRNLALAKISNYI